MATDEYASSREKGEQISMEEKVTLPATATEGSIAVQNDTFAIDREALGDNLPKNYYWSPSFIGTIVVRLHSLPPTIHSNTMT